MQRERKTVGEIVRDRPLYAIQEDEPVLQAVRYMTERRIGAVPALAQGRLVGILSERDIMTRVVARGLDPASIKVCEVMTKKPATMEWNNTYSQALLIMDHLHIRHLPVMDDGQLIGCVSMRELREIDTEAKGEEIEFLDDYIRKLESVM